MKWRACTQPKGGGHHHLQPTAATRKGGHSQEQTGFPSYRMGIIIKICAPQNRSEDERNKQIYII